MIKYNPNTKTARNNVIANKRIAKMFLDNDILYCEVCPILSEKRLLKGSCGFSGSNAHRHSRNWYKSNPDLLYNFKQVVFACIKSHQFIDARPNLKEEIFILLRGKE